MNAAQIASQIRDLSNQLLAALNKPTEDVNVAAVLGHLTPAFAASSTALYLISNIAENSDGPGWDTVMSETSRANHLLSVTSTGLHVAAKAAQGEQDKLAALLTPIRDETRPANTFFDALANLPGSAQHTV